MKSILISIRPKWCQKIISGEKTIEVRKTRPKMDTPFKCYIYCTADSPDLNIPISQERLMRDYLETGSMKSLNCPLGNGKVIGEFVCDRIAMILPANEPYGIYDIDDDYVLQTCLENGALWDYGRGGRLYGWHISNLKIYDTPRELSEFERHYECDGCDARWASECNACHDNGKLKRPPQSWCYVAEG